MFFSPSRAVLSAILRDEYLTSAVGTKEGDKEGSNQPPARDPVQFKLALTPKYLISYLEIPAPDPLDTHPCPIRMRAQSFPNLSRKAILKLQDQLSTAEVKYSSRKIALKTARDGDLQCCYSHVTL